MFYTQYLRYQPTHRCCDDMGPTYRQVIQQAHGIFRHILKIVVIRVSGNRVGSRVGFGQLFLENRAQQRGWQKTCCFFNPTFFSEPSAFAGIAIVKANDARSVIYEVLN